MRSHGWPNLSNYIKPCYIESKCRTSLVLDLDLELRLSLHDKMADRQCLFNNNINRPAQLLCLFSKDPIKHFSNLFKGKTTRPHRTFPSPSLRPTRPSHRRQKNLPSLPNPGKRGARKRRTFWKVSKSNKKSSDNNGKSKSSKDVADDLPVTFNEYYRHKCKLASLKSGKLITGQVSETCSASYRRTKWGVNTPRWQHRSQMISKAVLQYKHLVNESVSLGRRQVRFVQGLLHDRVELP